MYCNASCAAYLFQRKVSTVRLYEKFGSTKIHPEKKYQYYIVC